MATLRTNLVNCKIAPELSSLDQVEEDGVLLPDESRTNVAKIKVIPLLSHVAGLMKRGKSPSVRLKFTKQEASDYYSSHSEPGWNGGNSRCGEYHRIDFLRQKITKVCRKEVFA
jgi:hypothetical protein